MNLKGDIEGAESHYRSSLCMQRLIQGEDADYPDIAAALRQLGSIVLEKGDFDGRSRSSVRAFSWSGASIARIRIARVLPPRCVSWM